MKVISVLVLVSGMVLYSEVWILLMILWFFSVSRFVVLVLVMKWVLRLVLGRKNGMFICEWVVCVILLW